MRRAALLAVVLCLILGSPATAAPSAAQRCAAAKLTAVAKATKSILICRKKAILGGVAVDPACLAKAETKLAAALAKAEDKGGCVLTGHLAQVQGSVDACVDLFAYLEELPCGDGAGPAGEDVPCTCGNVVVTDTTLNEGFDPVLSSSCGGTGLEVASSVTLDLGGGTIGGGGGVGILPEPGVTIRNGTVQGFDVGILVRDGSATLTDLALNGNTSSGLIVGQADCGTSPVVVFDGPNAEISDNGGTGVLVHPCAALTITGPPGFDGLLPVLRNGSIGIDARAQLTASWVEVGWSASHGVKVESDAPVLLTDCHIHHSGQHPTLPAANGIGIYVLRTAVPSDLSEPAGFVIRSTESTGRSFVTYNGGHGVALGDLTQQSGPVVGNVGDVQMYENEIGIRVQQKNSTTARTEFAILSNNIFNNRDAGLYVSTSYQRPTPTDDRRVISSNDIHHNAITIDGCFPVPGEQVQFASQVVFDGPVMGTDPNAGVAGPDPVGYPDDYRCYWQDTVPTTETQCDRKNDPDDAISGGTNNHCIWIGTQCRLAWDIAGTAGTGECGTSDNRIFAYINDPARPEFTQKGLAATNGAFVLARRNTWGVGGAGSGTYAASGTDSEIDSEDACSTISTCTGASPP